MKIDYYATATCRPCKAFFPIVSAVANEYGVVCTKHDLSEAPDVAEQLNIVSVPTVILRDEAGEERVRFVGQQARATVAQAVSLMVGEPT
jgi:thioredoxin-like negative regulator of GroEL